MSKDKKPKNKKLNHWLIYGGALAIILAFQVFSGGLGNSSNVSTTPSQFFKYLKDGDIRKVEIVNKREALVYLTTKASSKDIHKKNKKSQFFPNSSEVPNYKFEFGDVQLFQKQLEDTIKEEDLDTSLNFKSETNAWGDILSSLIPFILIIGIWIFIMRRMSGGGAAGGGQIFNIGKSKAKLFDEKIETKTTFKDVAGLEGAKEEIQEIVDFLKQPEKYTALGGKIPKGALLVGPPGTGKSHTIVNILCSLLAEGKRVLVTAQTDKALESLLDNIPPTFNDLVFTKIQLEIDKTRFSLEKSINNIRSILIDEFHLNIENKISVLNTLKGEYLQFKSEIHQVLEKEYNEISLNNSFKDLRSYKLWDKLQSKNCENWNW